MKFDKPTIKIYQDFDLIVVTRVEILEEFVDKTSNFNWGREKVEGFEEMKARYDRYKSGIAAGSSAMRAA